MGDAVRDGAQQQVGERWCPLVQEWRHETQEFGILALASAPLKSHDAV